MKAAGLTRMAEIHNTRNKIRWQYRSLTLDPGKIAGKLVIYLMLILFSVLFLFPLYWMITTGMKASHEVFAIPMVWIPGQIHLNNYIQPFFDFPFARFYMNSFVIVFFCITGTLFSCMVAGYGFARYRVPGSEILFIILLSTMMLPSSVTLIPVFVIFSKFRFLNTYIPLILPAFFGSAFNIFLIRQFLMGIPKDMEESAHIDGAGLIRILTQIIVPMVKPALATITIFTFISTWNDFLGPLLYLNDRIKITVMLGLNFFKSQYGVQWSMLMAQTTLATIPCLVVFIIFQKYFVEGIALSGIKG
jgi:ABC-type glycerol-3-phosphate transport system permease component